MRPRTAVSEQTPDVAELGDVAGKRVVVEVVRVVIAVVDRSVAHEHHRFAIRNIGVCSQCVYDILDAPRYGHGRLVPFFGRKRVTRSHKDCGEADKLQEQSQARVGGFRHTPCQELLLLPLHLES